MTLEDTTFAPDCHPQRYAAGDTGTIDMQLHVWHMRRSSLTEALRTSYREGHHTCHITSSLLALYSS